MAGANGPNTCIGTAGATLLMERIRDGIFRQIRLRADAMKRAMITNIIFMNQMFDNLRFAVARARCAMSTYPIIGTMDQADDSTMMLIFIMIAETYDATFLNMDREASRARQTIIFFVTMFRIRATRFIRLTLDITLYMATDCNEDHDCKDAYNRDRGYNRY